MDATQSPHRVALATRVHSEWGFATDHLTEPSARSAQSFSIVLDDAKNDAAVGGKAAEIQADNSRIKILVLPTDEELSIAQQVGISNLHALAADAEDHVEEYQCVSC